MATQVQTINPTKTVTSNSESPPELSNVMSVGGGFGDDAVDVTYSTKPNNKVVSLGVSNYNQTTIKWRNYINWRKSDGSRRRFWR